MLLVLALVLPAALVRAADWQTITNAAFVASDSNDGDSFLVAFGRRHHLVRLYFVDCPEAITDSESDRRRLLEQSRHFGIEPPARAAEYGRQAALRTQKLLSVPFTVHTSFATAPGRSGRPRIYAMITLADGRDLAAVLVGEGLARAGGMQRALPDGTEASEYAQHLVDLELASAVERRGIWSECKPERLAELRRREREEARALADAFAAPLSAEHPLDLNACSEEDLQRISGIGPVLAARIVKARPFRNVDDLERVDGLGAAQISRMRTWVTVK